MKPVKLTEAQKAEIVEKFQTGKVTKAQLAREYGVSPRTIGRVIDSVHENAIPQEKPVTKLQQVTDEVENDDDEYVYEFVCTPTVITISRKTSKDSEMETITSEDERFNAIFTHITQNMFSQEALAEAFMNMSKKTMIEMLTFGNITVDPEVGELIYKYPGSEDEVKFSAVLANRVLHAVKQGVDSDDFVGLINFAERLAWNPDEQIIKQLYDFLVAKDIKINRDGFVVCYKKVRSDFKDIYTGKMDNSPGNTLKVKRSYVDANSHNTCSYGLHVCSWSYLRHYGSDASSVVLEVLVDPKDFVSIPYDYYETYENTQVPAKARVCEYYVERVIEDWNEKDPDVYYDSGAMTIKFSSLGEDDYDEDYDEDDEDDFWL